MPLRFSIRSFLTVALIPFLTFAVENTSLHLSKISDQQIIQLKERVSHDISRDTLAKRLVCTAGLVTAGYLGYRYFGDTSVIEPAIPATLDQIKINNQLLQRSNELLLQAMPEMQPSDSWIANSTIGRLGKWVWENGKWYTQQTLMMYAASMLMSGTSSTIGKLIKNVDASLDAFSFQLFHARDVKWFLMTRARLTDLFNQLEQHARCLETGAVAAFTDIAQQETLTTSASTVDLQTFVTVSVEEYAYRKQAFAQTWNQLVDRLAALAAFVAHQAEQTTQENVRDRMQLASNQITAITNATASRLEPVIKLADLQQLPADLQYEVQRLRASVSDELIFVNKLEHDTSW